MQLFSTFGIEIWGKAKLDSMVHATVTKVTACTWLKINTKPIRAYCWDGTVYPHMVHFQYAVDGVSYTGKRFWPHSLPPPPIGASLPLFYDAERPEKWRITPNKP